MFKLINFFKIQLPREKSLPISDKNLTRILIVIIVILSISAGFYQSLYRLENKKYRKLEDKYVRVRQVLGTEKTNELIESTYK